MRLATRAEAERHEHAEAQAERGEHDERHDDARREARREERVGERVESELVEDRERGQRREQDGHGAVGPVHEALAQQRPEPGGDEDRRERHRQRIGRIAEEPREPLDHRDLEEHETEPERGEVDRRDALGGEGRPLPAHERERQEQEDRRVRDGDPEQQQQHALTDDVFGVEHVERLEDVAQDVAERREVPEERRVVRDGRDLPWV